MVFGRGRCLGPRVTKDVEVRILRHVGRLVNPGKGKDEGESN